MANIEIRCGWPHDGRHGSLIDEAARVLGRSGMGPSLIYLVPTTDDAANVRDRLLERAGHGAVFGAPVVTFNTLVKKILSGRRSAEYRIIDDTEKELIVERILTEHVKTGKSSSLTTAWQSDQSRGIVRRLARVIEELKRNLCPDGASLLDEVGSLGAARLGRDVAALYDAYRHHLETNHLVDSAGTFFLAHEALLKSVEPFNDAFPRVSHLIVDGFRDFTEVEKKILEQIAGAVDRVTLSLDYVPETNSLFAATETTYSLYRELAEVADVSESTRPMEQVFERCAIHSETVHPPPGDCLEIRKYTDPRSEIGDVAAEVKRLLVEDGYERRPESIVVHVPNNDMWLDAAEETFRRRGIPVEIDAERPLDRSTAVDAVMSALRIRARSFDRSEVLALLANPYINQRPDVSVIERHATAIHITGGSVNAWIGSLEARVGALKARDDEGAAKSHREAETLDAAVRRLKSLLETISELPLKARPEEFGTAILELIVAEPVAVAKSVLPRDDAGRRPDIVADEAAALRRFGALVQEVCLAMQRCIPGEIPLDRMVEALTTAVTETKVRPVRGRTAGVKLRKWGEGAARRHDHVFLIGLTEDVLPERTPHRVFFRESHREQCKFLKTVATGVSRGWLDLMAAVLSARERVRLSWATTGWDDKPAAPSMYIDEIATASGVEIKEPDGRRPEPRDATELQRAVGAAIGRTAAGTEDAGYATDLVRELRRRDYGPLRSMTRAARIERLRTRRETGAYSGLIQDETLVNRLSKRFGKGAHVFSVSQLETYASCPFRFFIERVLELDQPDEFREDVLPKDRGEIVHEILRRFFARWQTESGKAAIEPADVDDAQTILQDEAETVLASSRVAEYGGVFWDALETDLCRGFKEETDRPGLLQAVLNKEAETDEHPTDRYLEWRFGRISKKSGTSDPRSVNTELHLPTARRSAADTNAVPVHIAGKIDRIDVFDDGSYKIWDYKTSSTPPSPKSVLAGDDYQLGVYALATEEALPVKGRRLDGVGYYKLSTAEDVDPKIAGKKKEDYDEMMDAVETNIIDDVTGIIAGKFTANADGNSCQYCVCRHICRN